MIQLPPTKVGGLAYFSTNDFNYQKHAKIKKIKIKVTAFRW